MSLLDVNVFTIPYKNNEHFLMSVINMLENCIIFKKQKRINGSTYKFPIWTVGHGNACDCYLDHLLDTLICQRSDSLYAQREIK